MNDGSIINCSISCKRLENLELDIDEYSSFLKYLEENGIKICFDDFFISDDITDVYFQDLKLVEVLPSSESRKLIVEYKKTNDKELRDKIIESHLKLVVSMARYYAFISKIELADLIQAGNEGLLWALENFDLTRNTVFSTYAVWGIKKSVNVYLKEYSRTIRLPAYVHDNVSSIKKTTDVLIQKLFRYPTNEELAEYTGLSLKRVERARIFANSVVSLDAKVKSFKDFTETDTEMIDIVTNLMSSDAVESESRFLNDTLPSSVNSDMEEVLDDMLYSSIYSDMEEVLNERELFIIKSHYGIGCESEMTLHELGRCLNISHERVSQIEKAAFAKIRKRLLVKNVENPYGEKSSNKVYVRE